MRQAQLAAHLRQREAIRRVGLAILREVRRFSAILASLTRNADIKLNTRVSLQPMQTGLA
jgi:hypothetical protein